MTPGHGTPDSPLFGIPVLLKDNINTNDMPTTAGSVALEGSIPPRDAFITRKLRRAGAIILGKATLTEFANFIAIGMPTGYSSLGPSVSTHMIRESIRVRRRIRIRQPPTAGRFLAPGGRAPDPASAWPRTS